MPALFSALIAFVEEQRRCGELDAAVELDLVRMTCDCGAAIAHPLAPRDRAR